MNILRFALPAAVVAASLSVPARAAVDNSDPQRLVQTLTTDGFAVIRTGNKAAARGQFRSLLMNHVAVDQIGDRLIRRWANTITPAQRAAYKAALPNYIVGTYADRLFDYADAKIVVQRAVPTAGGNADVQTIVTRPGRQPLRATWSTTNVGGQWKVLNLNVAGINVALAQQADFDSVVQRQGFDALVKMMRARG
jgi:phospholipid transport system substrate-binding protein